MRARGKWVVSQFEFRQMLCRDPTVPPICLAESMEELRGTGRKSQNLYRQLILICDLCSRQSDSSTRLAGRPITYGLAFGFQFD